MIEIDTTNMCSHLQRQLFDGEYDDVKFSFLGAFIRCSFHSRLVVTAAGRVLGIYLRC